MFCPCLKIFIQDRSDPILVSGSCHLVVIWGNRWSHTTKIGQSVIVHTDPVLDIVFRHTFGIKVIAVGKSSDKNGDPCNLFRVPTVIQIELLSGIIQFEIDAGITLDVEGQLFEIGPFAVAPAVLSIAHWLLPVYDTDGIVFLLQMFQGHPFASQSLIARFLVKILVEKLIRRYAGLFIEQALMYSFVTSAGKGYESSGFSLKRFRKLINGCFAAVVADRGDLTSSEMVHKVESQYSFVVHNGTSSYDISPYTGDAYIITGNLGCHLSHRIAAEYDTGGRFGWQSAAGSASSSGCAAWMIEFNFS